MVRVDSQVVKLYIIVVGIVFWGLINNKCFLEKIQIEFSDSEDGLNDLHGRVY